MFVAVGLSLARIRNERLYREKYDTFEAYLRDRWEFGRAHGHRLIEAATVVETLSNDEEIKHLSPRGDKPPLPACEAHVRRLIQLKPEDRPKAWKAAVELSQGQEATVKILKRALEPFEKPRPKKVTGKLLRLGSALAIVQDIEKAVRGGEEQAKILDLLQALKRALVPAEEVVGT